MAFTKEYLAELSARVDIVEVIRTFVPLRRRGRSRLGHIAPCPFHRDNKASFVVHSRLQRYHCHGCGKQGTAISFLQDFKKMSYGETIMYLAKKYTFYPRQWRAQVKKCALETK